MYRSEISWIPTDWIPPQEEIGKDHNESNRTNRLLPPFHPLPRPVQNAANSTSSQKDTLSIEKASQVIYDAVFDVQTPQRSSRTQVVDVACHKKRDLCYPLDIFTFQAMTSPHKSYRVAFELVNRTEELEWMGDTILSVTHNNGDFVIFECIHRVLFVIASSAMFIYFLKQMLQVSYSLWTDEQKYVLMLVLFLIGFNDPLFVFLFLKSIPALALTRMSLKITFYTCLSLYLLILLEVVSPDFRARDMKWKMYFSLNSWLAGISYVTAVHYKTTQDPFFDLTDEFSTLWPFHIWLILSAVVYCVWLALLLKHHLWNYRQTVWYYKILGLFTALAFGCAVYTMIKGPSASSAVEFIFVTVVLNVYVYLAAWFEMPELSWKGVQQSDEEAQEIIRSVYDEESDDPVHRDI